VLPQVRGVVPCHDVAPSPGLDISTTTGHAGEMLAQKCRAGERAPSEFDAMQASSALWYVDKR
jgi:hypothetical protein